jgi:hypothetical protein
LAFLPQDKWRFSNLPGTEEMAALGMRSGSRCQG